MAEDSRARLKKWLESGQAKVHPLAFSQRELWETSPVPVGDPANHICAFIEVNGIMAEEDCENALRRVVERHEVMRLSILPGKQQPLQLVRAAGEPVISFRELPSSKARGEAFEAAMAEVFEEPFDLLRGPLYRAQVLRRSKDELVLVFAIHHAIADGWSLGVLVQDLVAAYLQRRAPNRGALPPVPMTYTQWTAAERAAWTPARLEKTLEFWRGELAGALSPWDSPPGPRRLRRRVSMLPAETARAVREIVRQTESTLFSALLAAFQISLSRWIGAEDVVVGAPVANRTRPDARETMGYFSGNVPLRGQAERDRSFADSVKEVHRRAVDAFANAMPFAELAGGLGRSSNKANTIYDIRFALQNHPLPEVRMPGLSAKLTMRSTGTARFDLGCEITEMGAELEVVWLYRPELFSGTQIDDLEELFLSFLDESCAHPKSRVAALTRYAGSWK